MGKPIDMENLPPYKFWLLANYKPDESILIIMGHHSCLDGIGIFSMLQALTTEKDFSKLPRVSPPSFMQYLKSYIFLPFSTVH